MQEALNHLEIILCYSYWVTIRVIKTNIKYSMTHKIRLTMLILDCHLPLFDSFLVFMIFAANSWPVLFCTHRRTTEKAPLKQSRERTYIIILHCYIIVIRMDDTTQYICLAAHTMQTLKHNVINNKRVLSNLLHRNCHEL